MVVEAPRPLRIVRPKAADPARARPQDATERDVVTMAADEMEGDKEMGALVCPASEQLPIPSTTHVLSNLLHFCQIYR